MLPPQKMTVDEYLGWAELQPGRYELHAGAVYAMTPEQAGHAKPHGGRGPGVVQVEN